MTTTPDAPAEELPAELLAELPVVLSLGMGVDSAAILAYWLLNPDLCPFDLARLVVVTAMTGDESQATKDAMERHLLPLMAMHGVRYVQMSRAGFSDSDGIAILSDSCLTKSMVMRGPVTLSEELRRAVTIPQSSNRSCSLKWKGWVLDTWAEAEFAGAQRRHVIGFAAEETRRRDTDQGYAKNSPGKLPWYPLIEWGWDREKCLSYLREVFRTEWPRSCCGYCPFQAGKDIALLGERWNREPAQASLAVELETAALTLNPNAKLFKDRTAADVARTFGLGAVVDAAIAAVNSRPAALYEVRRIRRRAGDQRDSAGTGWVLGPDMYAPGQVWRSLATMSTGDRAEMLDLLTSLHTDMGGELLTGEHGVQRLVLLDGGAPYPSRERTLVVGPAGAEDKERGAFEELWTYVDALGLARQDSLFGGAR